MRPALPLAPFLLLLLGACSFPDAPQPPPAQALRYQDPSGAGWRLVKEPALSTPTHLVLDLLPPDDLAGGRGVALEATLGTPGADWTRPTATDPQFVRDGDVYGLDQEPSRGAVRTQQLLVARPLGWTLQAAALMKGIPGQGGARATPAYQGRPLLRLAVDLAPGEGPTSDTRLPLRVDRAWHMGADGRLEDIRDRIQVGELSAW